MNNEGEKDAAALFYKALGSSRVDALVRSAGAQTLSAECGFALHEFQKHLRQRPQTL
jgi:hypothetical protein